MRVIMSDAEGTMAMIRLKAGVKVHELVDTQVYTIGLAILTDLEENFGFIACARCGKWHYENECPLGEDAQTEDDNESDRS
jgi:hypothetical protein